METICYNVTRRTNPPKHFMVSKLSGTFFYYPRDRVFSLFRSMMFSYFLDQWLSLSRWEQACFFLADLQRGSFSDLITKLKNVVSVLCRANAFNLTGQIARVSLNKLRYLIVNGKPRKKMPDWRE